MKDLINKIMSDDYKYTGEQLITDLQRKKEWFPTLEEAINKAITALNADCFLRLKRSRTYWNKIVNERI